MINARRKDNENIVYMHIFTKKDTCHLRQCGWAWSIPHYLWSGKQVRHIERKLVWCHLLQVESKKESNSTEAKIRMVAMRWGENSQNFLVIRVGPEI